MAEAFHQWVNNLPWWEKLWYWLFDPQRITCSTAVVIPGIYFIIVGVAVGVGYLCLQLYVNRLSVKEIKN